MRSILAALMITTIFTSFITSAEAKIAMLPTIEIVEDVSMNETRAKVITFMNNENVIKEMRKMGVDSKEAITRVASLSKSELRTLSEQIDNAQAGGDFGVGGVIGVVVFVFLVLLVTDILGFTKVFPFTRSVN